MSTNRIPPASALLFLLGCSDSVSAGPAGLVALTQIEVAGTPQHVLYGYFADVSLDALRGGEPAGCVPVEEAGPCRRFECDRGLLVTHDAGTLSVVGGGDALTAAVSASLGAYSAIAPGSPLVPGDVVTFEASGGTVPAFTADVTVPRGPTFTLPSAIARTAPLIVSWNETDADGVQLTLAPTTRGPVISCRASGSAGTLSVAPELLDDYASGTSLLVSTSAFTATEVAAGDYAIEVRVAHGTTAAGTVD